MTHPLLEQQRSFSNLVKRIIKDFLEIKKILNLFWKQCLHLQINGMEHLINQE